MILNASRSQINICISLFRFILEEPPGVQKVYDKPSTPPPTKVTYLSDKDQKEWVKDVQGITEL